MQSAEALRIIQPPKATSGGLCFLAIPGADRKRSHRTESITRRIRKKAPATAMKYKTPHAGIRKGFISTVRDAAGDALRPQRSEQDPQTRKSIGTPVSARNSSTNAGYRRKPSMPRSSPTPMICQTRRPATASPPRPSPPHRPPCREVLQSEEPGVADRRRGAVPVDDLPSKFSAHSAESQDAGAVFLEFRRAAADNAELVPLGDYLGTHMLHIWNLVELNPAIYVPGNCVAVQYGLKE